MPEIILLRHGKSDWDAPHDHDRDRPLSRRGVGSAQTMGRVLTSIGRKPDLVIASPAARAQATAELASEAGGWEAPLDTVDALYGGGPESVLAAVHGVPRDVGRVLLVGHEPTWSATASLLIGGGDHRVATGTAVGLETALPWPRIGPATCRMVWLLPPRLFTDGRPAV
ncbi:MAG TPA: histidine phosphatase family protein [Gemmatimonadales bacterium]|nr:histidine phosphatase family protein [Gemmatimonadales bacterium]